MGLGALTLTLPCPLLPLGSRFVQMGFLLNPFPAASLSARSTRELQQHCTGSAGRQDRQAGFSAQPIPRQVSIKSLSPGQC